MKMFTAKARIMKTERREQRAKEKRNKWGNNREDLKM